MLFLCVSSRLKEWLPCFLVFSAVHWRYTVLNNFSLIFDWVYLDPLDDCDFAYLFLLYIVAFMTRIPHLTTRFLSVTCYARRYGNAACSALSPCRQPGSGSPLTTSTPISSSCAGRPSHRRSLGQGKRRPAAPDNMFFLFLLFSRVFASGGFLTSRSSILLSVPPRHPLSLGSVICCRW